MKASSFNGLPNIEELVRKGEHNEARRALEAIPLRTIQRKDIAGMANLCRRVGLIERGIRLLNPIVRGNLALTSATEKESIEYAVLLTRLGGYHEAREILAQIEPASTPEALLYSTFTLTPEWR